MNERVTRRQGAAGHRGWRAHGYFSICADVLPHNYGTSLGCVHSLGKRRWGVVFGTSASACRLLEVVSESSIGDFLPYFAAVTSDVIEMR